VNDDIKARRKLAKKKKAKPEGDACSCGCGTCGKALCADAIKALATKLKQNKGGKLVSARSKTGQSMCSQAMSTWKTSGMTPQVAATLGKCRAMARRLKMGQDARTAGNEARAQHHEAVAQRGGPVTNKDRMARARELRANRERYKRLGAENAKQGTNVGAERLYRAERLREGRRIAAAGTLATTDRATDLVARRNFSENYGNAEVGASIRRRLDNRRAKAAATRKPKPEPVITHQSHGGYGEQFTNGKRTGIYGNPAWNKRHRRSGVATSDTADARLAKAKELRAQRAAGGAKVGAAPKAEPAALRPSTQAMLRTTKQLKQAHRGDVRGRAAALAERLKAAENHLHATAQRDRLGPYTNARQRADSIAKDMPRGGFHTDAQVSAWRAARDARSKPAGAEAARTARLLRDRGRANATETIYGIRDPEVIQRIRNNAVDDARAKLTAQREAYAARWRERPDPNQMPLFGGGRGKRETTPRLARARELRAQRAAAQTQPKAAGRGTAERLDRAAALVTSRNRLSSRTITDRGERNVDRMLAMGPKKFDALTATAKQKIGESVDRRRQNVQTAYARKEAAAKDAQAKWAEGESKVRLGLAQADRQAVRSDPALYRDRMDKARASLTKGRAERLAAETVRARARAADTRFARATDGPSAALDPPNVRAAQAMRLKDARRAARAPQPQPAPAPTLREQAAAARAKKGTAAERVERAKFLRTARVGAIPQPADYPRPLYRLTGRAAEAVRDDTGKPALYQTPKAATAAARRALKKRGFRVG
jgi:hypothetical protein